MTALILISLIFMFGAGCFHMGLTYERDHAGPKRRELESLAALERIHRTRETV